MNNNTRTPIFMESIKRISELETERAVEAIGGSEELYVKMLSQTLRVLQSSIIQMDDYIGTENLNAFGVTVHGIKGSLRQAGYPRLAMTAETLETEAMAGNYLYCLKQYAPFKNELLRFYEQLEDAFRIAGDDLDAVPENMPLCDIAGNADTLKLVKTAIEECDCLLAAELLLPITRKKFGGRADELIKNTMEALECYRLEAALNSISKLFSECVGHDDCSNI